MCDTTFAADKYRSIIQICMQNSHKIVYLLAGSRLASSPLSNMLCKTEPVPCMEYSTQGFFSVELILICSKQI